MEWIGNIFTNFFLASRHQPPQIRGGVKKKRNRKGAHLRKDVMCVINLCIFTLYLLIAIFIEDMENKNITNKINQKWLKWFVGFNDAEGNFQVYPKKSKVGRDK